MRHRFLYSHEFHLINPPPQTGDVITFAQFEEGNLLNETRNDTEIDDASDSESIMMSERDMEYLGET